MKNIIKLLIAMFAFTAIMAQVSCGNKTAKLANGEDAPLGNVPGYFVEIAKEYDQLGIKLRETDLKKREKIRNEFDEYVKETVAKAEEEAQQLIGKQIPFDDGDIYDDLQVTEVVIDSYEGGEMSGSFILRIKATPKRDIRVRTTAYECEEGEYSLNDTRLYFLLVNDENKIITMGNVNPFSSNFANSKSETEFYDQQLIMAGVPCNSQGGKYSLTCHTYDFTRFAKIIFMKEADYNKVRQQMYGF